ncbi:hypothetical protein HK101_001543 [Irineochytrium annulatum]|nr:hypothetical protein HK101_001543 [Irineochytrium annulatum]
MKLTYPAVRRGTVIETLHNRQIADPYRHLEDPDAEETKNFVEAENKLFFGHIGKIAYRDALRDRLTTMYNYERFGCPFRKGSSYYYFHNSGLQAQSVLYRMNSLKSEPQTFLDPNKLSDDGTVSLNTYGFSHSGKMFAYGLSKSGSDWVSIHAKKVDDSKDLEDKPLEWAKFTGITWTFDDRGFFYSKYPSTVESDKAGTETDSSKNMSVMYHKIGTPQSADFVVYKDPEHPDYIFGSSVSDDGKYLILTISESCDPKNLIYIADLEKGSDANGLTGRFDFVKIVPDWKAEFSYVTNEGPIFYLSTTLDAPRRRIVKFDLTNRDKGFVEVIPQSDAVLTSMNVVDNDKLVLVYLQDVKHVIKVYQLSGKPADIKIDLPTGSIVKSMTGEKDDKELFFSFSSFTSPGVIHRFDFEKREQSTFRETKVANYNSDLFETKQVFYASKDGTKIPMYITHKKGLKLDGENPTLLYAYGGFNISVTPTFSINWLTFIEKFNGVVCVANIRGGGEYGEDWYNGGRLEKKQNCFTDFQCAARWLIDNKYTKPKKLAINGGSNGGLLVGACLNQAPELYGCGVADVGVMDLLRFHKFTIGSAWVSDFGNPDVAADFDYIIKISPLHNIRKDVVYPHVLITTSDHDDRVSPLHSIKYIATLQHEAAENPNPLLIRVDTKSGHGAGKSTQQIIEEAADKYTFITNALGAVWTDGQKL